MNPESVLRNGLDGDRQSRLDYNRLMKGGAGPVYVKAFLDGETMPALMAVYFLGPVFVRGEIGLAYPCRRYIAYDKVLKILGQEI